MNRLINRSRLAYVLQRLKIVQWDLDDLGLEEEACQIIKMVRKTLARYAIAVCTNCGRYQDAIQCHHCGCPCVTKDEAGHEG